MSCPKCGHASRTAVACRNCHHWLVPCNDRAFVQFNRAGVQRVCTGWVHDCEIDGLSRLHQCEGAWWRQPWMAEPARMAVTL